MDATPIPIPVSNMIEFAESPNISPYLTQEKPLTIILASGRRCMTIEGEKVTWHLPEDERQDCLAIIIKALVGR